MSDKEMLEFLTEASQKEQGLLSAFEACGRMISELKSEKECLKITVKNLEEIVSELEAELAKATKELEKVKGGRNEW